MFKLSFIISLLSIYLSATEADVSKFEYLETQAQKNVSNFDTKAYKNNISKNNDMSEKLKSLDMMTNGDDFLTKEESIISINQVKDGIKLAQKPHVFLLYFFSESVPKDSVSNFLFDVSLLKKNKIDIDTKQYMIGAPEDYETYMKGWTSFLDNNPYKLDIIDQFHMKFAPDFFGTYEIKRVPAIALATCSSIIPSADSCRVNYLIHGDVSLVYFFDKISKENPKYKKYVKFLDANGIYKEVQK